MKSLRRVPPKHLRQIKASLMRLGVSPRPHDHKKLKVDRGYRVTAGEYRVLYTIDDEARIVTVYKIVKRNDYDYRD
jgi:mRNA interferase RelE/StbE